MPHSTQVAGYAAIYGGDDRHVGNLYLGDDHTNQAYDATSPAGQTADFGTAGYNGHPPTRQAFMELVADVTRGDHQRFADVKQPVYIHDNVYGGGANPYDAEQNAVVISGTPVRATVIDEGEQVYLEVHLPDAFDKARVAVTTGEHLEPVRFVNAEFEEPDGSSALLIVDLTGTIKDLNRQYPAGPLAALTSGATRLRLW